MQKDKNLHDAYGLLFVSNKECICNVELKFYDGLTRKCSFSLKQNQIDFFGNKLKKKFFSSQFINLDGVEEIKILTDNCEAKVLYR